VVGISLGVSWGGRRSSGVLFLAKPFDVSFGLLTRLIDLLAYLGNVLARWLDIDDEALRVG
jgi:hypothetical protein